MSDNTINNIKQFLLHYVDFNELEISAMNNFIKTIRIKKNEVFINENEIAKYIAFTNKGYLRVYYNHNGNEITRDITPLHSFVTALPSFISQTPSFEIIKAITDCELIIIHKNDLDYLYTNYTKWERFGRKIMEEMFVESQRRVYSFITETAEDRYRRIMKQYPDMIREVPLTYIADFIGIKLQSLSRLRKTIEW